MRAPLDLRQLQVFVAVAESGGFGRAARALGVAQSTVSEAVAGLERSLGAAVLARMGRGTALTPAGEALLPHARGLLRGAADAVTEVGRVAEAARVQVRVAAPESVTAWLLPEAAARVRRRFPGAQFHFQPMLCADVRSAVREGRVDLGLVLEPRDPADPASERVAEVPLLLFAAADHPLARRGASVDELWRYRFAFSEPGGHYHVLLRGIFETAGYPMPAVEVVGSVEGVRRMVLADHGALGVLPGYVLAADLSGGHAALVRPPTPAPLLELRRLTGASASPPADALVEAIRVALSQDPSS